MAMKNLGKPNLSSNIKTGYSLTGRGVVRGSLPQRANRSGNIASNHPLASVRKALGGGRTPSIGHAPKKTRMY